MSVAIDKTTSVALDARAIHAVETVMKTEKSDIVFCMLPTKPTLFYGLAVGLVFVSFIR